MYRGKKVLGRKAHYREDGRIVFCYGDRDSVHHFIQGQRGDDAPDVRGILRRYAVEVLGWLPETAKRYAFQDYPVLDGLTPSGK